jgi:serine phosphatase RsbU (regulator of sigma subunit)
MSNSKSTVVQPMAPAPIAVDPRQSPWQQAHRSLQEIEDELLLLPDAAQRAEMPLRLLVERIPAILEALKLVHQDLDRQIAQRTAELSQANTKLKERMTEIVRAQRRLTVEHAVARILTECTTIAEAAPRILQGISQGLGWELAALWTVDRDAEALRCIETWHAPTCDSPAFEQASRLHRFSRGIDLPGRVWVGGSAVWIADLSQDADFPRAPIAAMEGLHAAVGFPIRNGTEFHGVMEFFSLKIRQPDEELLQMMTSIGSHISQFIERLKAEKALVLKEVELSIAQRIQEGLVAKTPPPALGGFDIAGQSHCAAETGGDYFDFFPLLESRQGASCQGIVIADASGHGLGPALLITETRAYLRAFALTSDDIGRIVSLVNCRVAEDVGDDHFVTLFLTRLDSHTRSLHYTSAGHPKGCIIDSSGNRRTFLECTGPPLGVYADYDFPCGPAITLQAGDLVLLLTDGILEAVAPDGTPFGMQRAIDIVRAYRKDPAALIVHNLYHAVRAFSHNHTQVDDMTAVVIKVREDTHSPPSHAEAWTHPPGQAPVPDPLGS